MKRLFIFFLVGILVMGCQDQLANHDPFGESFRGTKAIDACQIGQIDEPFVFLAEKDFKAWTDIVSLEDRFAACEVPETILHMMTTDALVKSALNYPLNFIYSAYNNPFNLLDLIIKNSTLHRELLGRSDAAEVLIRYFAQSTIDTTNTDSFINRSESVLSYANELFFDYLMASPQVSGLFNEKEHEKVQRIADCKIAERRAEPEYFSEWAVAPLLRLSASSENMQTRSYYVWEWLTPMGKSVWAYNQDEMTNYEINYWTDVYSQNYPLASVHAMASGEYNGNGYVWLMMDPTDINSVANEDNSWLENGGGSGGQMQQFWNEDFYQNCSASDSEKVYYGTAMDHSAIPYSGSDTNYISKWGCGPLMEHALAYCPYSTSALSYYRIRTTPATISCSINGPDFVALNVSNAYTFESPVLRGITKVWSAEAYSGWTSSFYWNPSTHQLTCYQDGAYKIIVQGKYNNNVLVYKEKTVICLPN